METIYRLWKSVAEELFQYPLVDWGDGDVALGTKAFSTTHFSILWWIGVMET